MIKPRMNAKRKIADRAIVDCGLQMEETAASSSFLL